MKIKVISIGILVALSLAACTTQEKAIVSESGIQWSKHKTLTEAIEQARVEDKIVFIDFYTTWCTPCKMMDQDVYSDEVIADFFNDQFINFKVNCEKGSGPNLAFLYQVQMYPVLVFIDQKGRELTRKNGAAYHSELMSLARQALLLNPAGS